MEKTKIIKLNLEIKRGFDKENFLDDFGRFLDGLHERDSEYENEPNSDKIISFGF